MKKTIFAIASVLVLASCKKEKDVTAPAPAEKKLTKVVNVYNGGTPETNDYTYDAQGRLLTMVNNSSIEEYAYPTASKITMTRRNKSNNSIQNILDYSVNADGRITILETKNPSGTVIGTTDYVYDAQGYIQRVTYTYNGSSPVYYEYTVNNGNYTGQKFYSNGTLSSTTTFTVDTSKSFVSLFNAGGNFPSRTLFGKPAKNPVVETRTVDAAGTVTWLSQTSFQLDAAGYILSSTINYPLLGTQGISTYTYN